MPATRSTTKIVRLFTRSLHEFNPDSCNWEDWEILFDTYLEVEGISNEIKKRNLLISSLGVQAFKALISICEPHKLIQCTYAELAAKRQEASKSITDFANELRDKATTCGFPSSFYEEALVTVFVGGLQNDHIRKQLMQNLATLEETINLARIFETVLLESSSLKQKSSNDTQQVNKSSKTTTCVSCGSGEGNRQSSSARSKTDENA